MDTYPLLELDPDVLCSRTCGRVAVLGMDLDATTDGTLIADLLCEPCAHDLETR